ncbi:MAG: thiopeptide-type bacteriocin biosynthesis protein [Phaeodactylibacter sp.]|nr:thiopeptide-type bacteriocin biosynthesis protein [Phaeodactylibacter sp.]
MAAGGSAANLISRYSLFDPAVQTFLNHIAEAEDQIHAGRIVAEVTHIPRHIQAANILQRSEFRNYELPFMTVSDKPKERQISLEDLYISCPNGYIKLWSKQQQKEVIPKFSSSFNYAITPHPIFQFLCDLQTQHQRQVLFFKWGPLHQDYGFLPRVRYKDITLFRATWRLKTEEIEALNKGINGKNARSFLSEWRAMHQMPRYIALVENVDRELFVDLDSNNSLGIIQKFFSKRTQATIKEYLYAPEQAMVRDEQEAGYPSEFFVAFARKTEKKTSTPSPRNFKDQIQRSFPPGSEWVYFKIYTGTKSGETLLVKVFPTLIQELMSKGLVDRWFFLRYADSGYHLRCRFHVAELQQVGQVIQTINQHLAPAVESKLISKVQIDQYVREVERYGQSTMELSEQCFFAESQQTLMLLQIINQAEQGETLRWQLGFVLTDQILNVFQLKLEEKVQLLEKIRLPASNKHLAQQLSTKFRELRSLLPALLDNSHEAENPVWQQIRQVLQLGNQLMEPVAAEILKQVESGEGHSKESLLQSYIHMMINRLCKTSPNRHEVVIYEFLYRHYNSKLARS